MTTCRVDRRSARTQGLLLIVLCWAVGMLPVRGAPGADPSRLKVLTTDQAAELVKQSKPLQLSVTELSPEVAAILAGGQGDVQLGALAEITPEAAAALAKCRGPLSLPKLSALTPAVAAALAPATCRLHLPGVTALTPEAAAAIAPHAGLLDLSVKELSDDTAAALARHVGDMRLDGLTSLTSLPLAERLGRQKTVWITSVTQITPEIARALCPATARDERWIDIGLTDMSAEVAALLMGSFAGFGMHGLQSISDDAAASMSGPFVNMRLWGLKTLSPAAAVGLAKGSGILDIRMFGPELADDTARALAKQIQTGPCRAIDFGRIKKLTVPEFAVLVVGRAHLHGGLGSVAELSDDVARALAESQGPLKALPSLTALTSAPLAAKYAAQGGVVSFTKLTTIPDDVAAALATHKGKTDLSGLKSLSVPAARAFAAHEGELVLDGLQEIGDEAAESLAKAVGPVSLKRLKRISLAARAALGANPRIALPPDAATR